MSKYVYFTKVCAYLNKLLHAEVLHIVICTLCFILLIQKSKRWLNFIDTVDWLRAGKNTIHSGMINNKNFTSKTGTGNLSLVYHSKELNLNIQYLCKNKSFTRLVKVTYLYFLPQFIKNQFWVLNINSLHNLIVKSCFPKIYLRHLYAPWLTVGHRASHSLLRQSWSKFLAFLALTIHFNQEAKQFLPNSLL